MSKPPSGPVTTAPSSEPPASARQMRKLSLQSEAGKAYFEALCRDVRRVVLRPLRDGNLVEYPATLAGRLDGTSLMIDWPSDREGLVPVRVGERVDVKFFSERDLVMFQVDVGLCCFRPRPYLHLQWPKEIAVVEVRTIARLPISKRAVFVRPAEGGLPEEQIGGRLVNLSLGGAAFVSESGLLPVLTTGQLILSINPDAGRTAVYVRPACTLRSRRELPPGEGFQYGIQFLDLSINDRLVLLAIVGEAALYTED